MSNPYVCQGFSFRRFQLTGKLTVVKKLFCYLLISWLALIAGGANAHSISDTAHAAEHFTHMHAADTDAATHEALDINSAVADSTDHCNQSHCGHSHGAAIPTSPGTHLKANNRTHAPNTSSRWASAAIADSIERPKWPLTTSAVVSLLS